MSSTLLCVKGKKGYECRLITDNKLTEVWNVKDVEVESEEGKEISSEIEASLLTFIATTDDYFSCSEENSKLRCVGTVKAITKHKGGFWERLLGEAEKEATEAAILGMISNGFG